MLISSHTSVLLVILVAAFLYPCASASSGSSTAPVDISARSRRGLSLRDLTPDAEKGYYVGRPLEISKTNPRPALAEMWRSALVQRNLGLAPTAPISQSDSFEDIFDIQIDSVQSSKEAVVPVKSATASRFMGRSPPAVHCRKSDIAASMASCHASLYASWTSNPASSPLRVSEFPHSLPIHTSSQVLQEMERIHSTRLDHYHPMVVTNEYVIAALRTQKWVDEILEHIAAEKSASVSRAKVALAWLKASTLESREHYSTAPPLIRLLFNARDSIPLVPVRLENLLNDGGARPTLPTLHSAWVVQLVYSAMQCFAEGDTSDGKVMFQQASEHLDSIVNNHGIWPYASPRQALVGFQAAIAAIHLPVLAKNSDVKARNMWYNAMSVASTKLRLVLWDPRHAAVVNSMPEALLNVDWFPFTMALPDAEAKVRGVLERLHNWVAHATANLKP